MWIVKKGGQKRKLRQLNIPICHLVPPVSLLAFPSPCWSGLLQATRGCKFSIPVSCWRGGELVSVHIRDTGFNFQEDVDLTCLRWSRGWKQPTCLGVELYSSETGGAPSPLSIATFLRYQCPTLPSAHVLIAFLQPCIPKTYAVPYQHSSCDSAGLYWDVRTGLIPTSCIPAVSMLEFPQFWCKAWRAKLPFYFSKWFFHAQSHRGSAADICHLLFSCGQQWQGMQFKVDGGLSSRCWWALSLHRVRRSALSLPNTTLFA